MSDFTAIPGGLMSYNALSFKFFSPRTGEVVVVRRLSKASAWFIVGHEPEKIVMFVSLAEFQKYFKCSDEELAIVKLKYGAPTK